MLLPVFALPFLMLKLCHGNQMSTAIMAYSKEDSPGNVFKQCVFLIQNGEQVPKEIPLPKDMVKMHSIPQEYQCKEPTINPLFNNAAIYIKPSSKCLYEELNLITFNRGKYVITTTSLENELPTDLKILSAVLLFQKDVEKMEKIVGGVDQWNGSWRMGIYNRYSGRKESKSRMYLPTICVMLIAVIAISFGSLLGALHDRDHGFTCPLASTQEMSQTVLWITVGLFILFMVTLMLLLYYFYNYMVWPLMILAYVLFTYTAQDVVFDVSSRLCGFGKERFKLYFSKPIFGKKSINYMRLGLLVPIIAMAIVCFVMRHTTYGFILLDIFGLLACTQIIKNGQIPALKVLAMLLVAVFFYDIFMVFITPMIMGGGSKMITTAATPLSTESNASLQRNRRSVDDARSQGDYDPFKLQDRYQNRQKSVMETVAIGGDEQLPLTFKIPRFNPFTNEFEEEFLCLLPVNLYTYLGFGDVVLPGLLGHFAWSFDMMNGFTVPRYFLVFIIGYIFGLFFTGLSLFLMSTAQPALLFLVPCTLFPIMVMALLRRELKLLWEGPFREESGMTDSLTANVTELPDRKDEKAMEDGVALNRPEEAN